VVREPVGGGVDLYGQALRPDPARK
jgi:hypothetical protein